MVRSKAESLLELEGGATKPNYSDQKNFPRVGMLQAPGLGKTVNLLAGMRGNLRGKAAQRCGDD